MKTLRMAGALALACLTSTCAFQPAAAQADSFPDSDASSPCRHWTSITPSDTVNLARLPKAIYVGSIAGGTSLTVIGIDAPQTATGVTWTIAYAGQWLPIRARRVLASGTNVSALIACY